MPTPTVLDTNIVVGLLDTQDVWSERALELRGFKFIASFDTDFDRVDWIQRIAQPIDLP